jgi:hypothetical protein
MATQTIYKPVFSCNETLCDAIEKETISKPFKTINAVHKFLIAFKAENKITEKLDFVCAWSEKDTKQPEGVFNPCCLGFRTFDLEKEGNMSYSRFPEREY